MRQDEIQYPDGQLVNRTIITHRGAVALLPVDDKRQIWFVRQYRHAAGERLLEIPAGTLEEGESPEKCAHREIREELGMAAGKLRPLGRFFVAPGYSSELIHIYLATNLHPAPLQPDEDEKLSVEKIPLEVAYAMAHEGKLRDAKTLVALFMAQSELVDV